MPLKLKRFRLGSTSPSWRALQQRGWALICSSTSSFHWALPMGCASTAMCSCGTAALSNKARALPSCDRPAAKSPTAVRPAARR